MASSALRGFWRVEGFASRLQHVGLNYCIGPPTRAQTPRFHEVCRAHCGRYMSSLPPPGDKKFSELRRFEDANPTRIEGINVNPDGIGSKVLPGNLVYKYYKWTGNTRKIPLELAHGYFWMLKDLKNTGGKPTLPNSELIPEKESQTFPTLNGVESLSNVKTDLPYAFISDKAIKCTLVNIAFRESGYKNISSWMDPFVEAFEGERSVDAMKVCITERRSLYLLRSALTNLMKKNTAPKEHDKTLLYFGSDVDDFRDILRMHNIMANYVFLVDGFGQVRFASSGAATKEEVDQVIGFAKELSSMSQARHRDRKSSNQRKK